MLMTRFSEKSLARLNGILQTFTGLGMLVGPILGSLLFRLGGFQLPFYTVGILLLLLAFYNSITISADSRLSFVDQGKPLLEIDE